MILSEHYQNYRGPSLTKAILDEKEITNQIQEKYGPIKIGKDIFGHTKNYLVLIVMEKILDVILSLKMEENIGFMDSLMISINILIHHWLHQYLQYYNL